MKRRGFNLFEVVIAIALILALTGTMYGFLRQLLATRDQAATFSDRQRAANTLIDRLRRDLTTCIAGDPSVGAGVSGGENMLRVAARSVPGSLASRGSADPAVFSDLHLSVYRFAPQRRRMLVKRDVLGDQHSSPQSNNERPSDNPDATIQPLRSGDQQPLPFSESTSDGFAADAPLMNSATNTDRSAIGSADESQQGAERSPLPAGFHALDGEFYKLRFRYHDGNTWQNTYNSQQNGSLPVAVEVAIWFNPWPGELTDSMSQQTPGAEQAEQTDAQQSSRLTFDDTAGFDEQAVAFASDRDQRDIPDPDRIAVIVIPDAQPEERSAGQQTGAGSSPSTQQPTGP